MRVLIYTMTDGSVRFGRISLEDGTLTSGIQRRIAGGLSEAAAIAEVAEKDKPPGTLSWRLGDSTELPAGQADGTYDKTFIGAMEDTGAIVTVNLTKARPIHMDRIRGVRGERLASLDDDWMRAFGRKDTILAGAIEAERETLRNIPQTFDLTAATTPDALKALWPAELPALA